MSWRSESELMPMVSRITAKRVENLLASYALHLPRIVDPYVETAAFPSLVTFFTDLVYHHDGWPPPPEVFVRTFRTQCERSAGWLVTAGAWPATEARLLRAYPSFVRELHLSLLLTERGMVVVRDAGADQGHGLDLIVLAGHYAVGLATYVDTPRSRAYRERKRATNPPGALVIEVPLCLRTATRAGNFLLYGCADADHIDAAVKQLTRYITRNGSDPGRR